MTWCEDWPFIGLEQNGDGIGEPVILYRRNSDSYKQSL